MDGNIKNPKLPDSKWRKSQLLDKIVASVSLDKILEKSVKMYKIPSLGISQRQLR